MDDGSEQGLAVEQDIKFCTDANPGSPPPPATTNFVVMSASYSLVDESLWGSEALKSLINSTDATLGGSGSSAQVVGARQSAEALFELLSNGNGTWSTQAEVAVAAAIATDLGVIVDDVKVRCDPPARQRGRPRGC